MRLFLGHAYFLDEDPVEKKVMRPYPPLGLLSVSAYLEEKGIQHEVFDGTFQTSHTLRSRLLEVKPDIVAFYVNFLTRLNVVRTVRFIRESADLINTRIALGGPDVRYHSENYLESGANYLVVGEGEHTLYSLVRSIEENRSTEKIPGLVFRSDTNKTIRTDPAAFIQNLDELPFPNRKSVDMKKYLSTWKKHQGYSSLTVNTQRGCPFTCQWCSHAVFGDTYRRRSPESVVEELCLLQQTYKPDSFWFVDDVFTMSEKWLVKFAESLQKQKRTISYECITRADRLSDTTLSLLRKTGCRMLWIGAESGSQKVLDRMKRGVDATVVREKLKKAKELGMETGTFIMLGYPGEKKKDIKDTVHHLRVGGPDRFTINLAYPIKGTGLYDEVKDSINCAGEWETTPDRDLDYKREYPRKFYDFAIRYVYNAVEAERSRKNNKTRPYLIHKIKALLSGLAMDFYSNRNN